MAEEQIALDLFVKMFDLLSKPIQLALKVLFDQIGETTKVAIGAASAKHQQEKIKQEEIKKKDARTGELSVEKIKEDRENPFSPFERIPEEALPTLREALNSCKCGYAFDKDKKTGLYTLYIYNDDLKSLGEVGKIINEHYYNNKELKNVFKNSKTLADIASEMQKIKTNSIEDIFSSIEFDPMEPRKFIPEPTLSNTNGSGEEKVLDIGRDNYIEVTGDLANPVRFVIDGKEIDLSDKPYYNQFINQVYGDRIFSEYENLTNLPNKNDEILKKIEELKPIYQACNICRCAEIGNLPEQDEKIIKAYENYEEHMPEIANLLNNKVEITQEMPYSSERIPVYNQEEIGKRVDILKAKNIDKEVIEEYKKALQNDIDIVEKIEGIDLSKYDAQDVKLIGEALAHGLTANQIEEINEKVELQAKILLSKNSHNEETIQKVLNKKTANVDTILDSKTKQDILDRIAEKGTFNEKNIQAALVECKKALMHGVKEKDALMLLTTIDKPSIMPIIREALEKNINVVEYANKYGTNINNFSEKRIKKICEGLKYNTSEKYIKSLYSNNTTEQKLEGIVNKAKDEYNKKNHKSKSKKNKSKKIGKVQVTTRERLNLFIAYANNEEYKKSEKTSEMFYLGFQEAKKALLEGKLSDEFANEAKKIYEELMRDKNFLDFIAQFESLLPENTTLEQFKKKNDESLEVKKQVERAKENVKELTLEERVQKIVPRKLLGKMEFMSLDPDLQKEYKRLSISPIEENQNNNNSMAFEAKFIEDFSKLDKRTIDETFDLIEKEVIQGEGKVLIASLDNPNNFVIIRGLDKATNEFEFYENGVKIETIDYPDKYDMTKLVSEMNHSGKEKSIVNLLGRLNIGLNITSNENIEFSDVGQSQFQNGYFSEEDVDALGENYKVELNGKKNIIMVSGDAVDVTIKKLTKDQCPKKDIAIRTQDADEVMAKKKENKFKEKDKEQPNNSYIQVGGLADNSMANITDNNIKLGTNSGRSER